MNVQANNVSLFRDGHLALDRVSLNVAPGDWVQIFGGPGSGKTTLLKALSGLLKVDSGDVLWEGMNLDTLSAEERQRRQSEIGMVFQSDALFDSMTVLENVELPLLYRKIPPSEARQRAEKALEWVFLLHARTALPEHLSGGMKKRAGLARALVSEPSLLLADDPFAGLDPATAWSIGNILRENTKGKSMILCAPEQISMLPTCRLFRMKAGRLEPSL